MKNQVRFLLVLTLAPWFGSGCAHLERPAAAPGARVPWTRYEAEHARSNVQPATPDRTYLTPESEAAGRSFVRLEKAGDYVEFTAVRPANGLVLRFSLPDGAQGQGIEATLSLLINGQPVRKLNLTSRFAWSYGDFPWSNDPAAGRGHHFFDEAQTLLPALQAGDVIRLQRDDTDTAPYYLVDFIELEPVPPPLPQPTNSLSIAEFGGVPGDTTDDTAAFLTLLEAARQQQKIAWLPPGTYRLEGSFKGMGNVDLRGAGMWHSRLAGPGAMFYGIGARFAVSDLAIFGDITHRNDMSPDNAFNGNLGDGTTLTRVWMEHVKCGVWSTHGTKNLRLTGCRIRNTMADGLNFCDGTTDATVE